jgi:hypothetical protein
MVTEKDRREVDVRRAGTTSKRQAVDTTVEKGRIRMLSRRSVIAAAVLAITAIALLIPVAGGASAKDTYSIYYSTSFNGNG